jgi:hypothetical protein
MESYFPLHSLFAGEANELFVGITYNDLLKVCIFLSTTVFTS